MGIDRPVYGALFYFLARYKRLYSLILLVTVVVSVLESFSIAAFFPLFSSMLGDGSGESGGIISLITQVVELVPVVSPIVAASLMLIAIFLLKTFGILTRDLLLAYAGAKVLYNTKKQIMDRYSAADYQFMLDSQQGAMIYNGLGAPTSVSGLLSTLSLVVTSLLKAVAVSVVLVSIDPRAAGAFIGLGAVYYLSIHYLSNKVSFKLGAGRVRASTEQTVIANEFLSGFRQIISFNTAANWVRRFDKENRTYSSLYAKDLAWRAIPRPVLELSALALLLGFVLFIRATSPGTFEENLPAMGVFVLALFQVLSALSSFGGTRWALMKGLPDMQVVHQIVTQSVPPRLEGDQQLASFQEAIIFENVTFAHKDRDTLLDGVSMSFQKGKVTAIVGPSGSGKTTLVNLILGLFVPAKGRITVDGISLQDLTHETWLGRIGLVSQDPFIYNTTIEENILFLRNGKSRESVIQAAVIANAHGFISEFPEEYDTVVADRGMKLSGGQQQRVCIARAILNSPEILIFDEATSSLDSISERQVQEAIDNAQFMTDGINAIFQRQQSSARRDSEF